jgi:hypothetical protein
MKAKITMLVLVAIAVVTGLVVAAGIGDVTEDLYVVLTRECPHQLQSCAGAPGGWELLAGSGR